VSATQALGTDGAPSTAAPAAAGVQPDADVGTEVGYRYSPSFPGLLDDLGCSLLLSTYQAGQLVAVGVADGQLSFSFRRFDQAMGVAVGRDRVAVAGREQIWFLRDHSELAAAIEPRGRHDRCWLPRTSIATGDIRCHEIAWGHDDHGEPDLWVVNTLFSCLAGVDPRYSFVPRWRPRFVSELAAQDRCHLNGLALRDGAPAFVTVMAPTDTPSGWRAGPNTRGAVLDVATSEPVTTGLTMPHSPRWHDDTLFVLHSGLGRLETVDPAGGHREQVALVPGYARGLAFHQHLAFVGLSRIRETAVFGGAPIGAAPSALADGGPAVWALSTTDGNLTRLDPATSTSRISKPHGSENASQSSRYPSAPCRMASLKAPRSISTTGSGTDNPGSPAWFHETNSAHCTSKAPTSRARTCCQNCSTSAAMPAKKARSRAASGAAPTTVAHRSTRVDRAAATAKACPAPPETPNTPNDPRPKASAMHSTSAAASTTRRPACAVDSP
jgi:uncharacterized protein (TIGR03032 family)